MKQLAWVLALCPAVAAAEFEQMNGPAIEAALTGRALVYDGGATQEFRASGRTLYNAGQPSWGYWATRGDQYCSQWPPSDGWACYDMTRDGDVFRFIAEDGSTTDGMYTQ